MPDLLTAVVGGLIGAGLTAFSSYRVQNKLAANRRKEQEQRIAYVRLVQISELIAAQDLIGRYVKAMLDVLRKGGHDLKEEIPKGPGYSQKHAIAATFAKAVEEAAKKEASVDLSVLTSPLVAKALTRMLDFAMTPSELADLPKDAVYAYSSFASLVTNFRISIEFILQSLGDWKLAHLKADFLLDTYETMILMLEKAKELRAALILRGGVTPHEAARLHAQQYQHLYKLLVLSQSNRASNEAARKALEAAANPDDGSPSS